MRYGPIQCADCGRFCGEADFALGHCEFEPDSEFGRERIEWTCRRCVASAIEARRAAAENTDAIHESATAKPGRPMNVIAQLARDSAE